MNLCCLVNPLYICDGCGEHFCIDHFYTSWVGEDHSHRYLRGDGGYYNIYNCPVAKEVKISATTRRLKVVYEDKN